ncbi:MAG: hypothetical protein HC839_02565, partial [Leptolyngbyaceae cyanobacterium RM2_2_21]|nr:hypothetical protein [Leptolyngbyaceae cyanobacterium RM2_2_21]
GKMLRDWCIHRYSRVERVLRSSHYNFQQFPEHYWAEVRRDLANQSVPTAAKNIESAYRLSEVSRFLKLSPSAIRAMQAGLQILEHWPLQETALRFFSLKQLPAPLRKVSGSAN